MGNLSILKNIFAEVFSVDVNEVVDDFNKDSIDCWDSVHQLSLTSMVEDEFDILLDAEDIIEFSSFESAKKILSKYDIEL